MTPDDALPPGFRVALGDDVQCFDSGRILLGGSPTRVLRLSDAAASLLHDGEVTVHDENTARFAERLLDAGVAHPDPSALPAVALDQLTVVIPTFGRSSSLRELLASLTGVRVIVVDDATPGDDAVLVAAAATDHGAQLVRMSENSGPAGARNAGFALVTTPFVAFIDTDAVATPDALAMLLRHFADPHLAAVGPRIAGKPETKSTWISQYENSRSSLDLGGRPALVRPRAPVSWISSTCVIARVAHLGDGFGAGLRVAEDVDLVWRLHDEGWRVRYEPRVTVTHQHRRHLRQWAARKTFYGTGAAILSESHPAAVVPAILRPWSLGVLLALIAGRRWSVPVAATITGFAWLRLARRLPGSRRVRQRLAAKLTLEGLVAAWFQLGALALRHLWPLGLLAAIVSRRARWVVAAMGIIDGIVEHRRLHVRQRFLPFFLARRIDDLAYGAGVWAGAARRRSVKALIPELLPRRDTSKGTGGPNGVRG